MNLKKAIRVLVVDDERVVRDFLARLLSLKGMEVRVAEDGYKAIKMAKQENFDFTFLDVRMPGIGGLRTLRELKKLNPDSAYVMMTGYAVDDVLRQAEEEGAVVSIKKPFEIKQVLNIIESGELLKEAKKKLAIIVVDDDKAIREFFKGLFNKKLHNVTAVASAEEALKQIKQKEFDLAFIDIVLKDINGIELLAQMRKIRPNLNTVLITGYPEVTEKAGALDIEGFLYKPLEIDKILSLVDKTKREKKL